MAEFAAYTDEYNGLNDEIKQQLSALGSCDPSKSGAVVSSLEELFKQQFELIKQMKIEIRTQPTASRKMLGDRIVEFESETNKLQLEFQRGKERSNRSSLLGQKSIEQRGRLLDVAEK